MLNSVKELKEELSKRVFNKYVKDHYGVENPGLQYDKGALEELKLSIYLWNSDYSCSTVTCQ